MAISLVGTVGSITTSAALNSLTGGSNSSPSVGDYIILWLYKNTVTVPTTPAGYTTIDSASANANAGVWAYKISDGTETTTGTSTGASLVQAGVYRGVGSIGGENLVTRASAASNNVPAVSAMLNTTGMSWVVVSFGSRQAISISTPAGVTLRDTQTGASFMSIFGDSNGGVTSWAAKSTTEGAAATAASGALELNAQAPYSTVPMMGA